MKQIKVINYGLSNLLSVQRAFEHLGAQVEFVNTPEGVLAAEALVLPGVGAFKDGMAGLERLGLIEPILQKAAAGTPLLGICLGMQMLFDESDEFGLHKGLGLIPGRVEKIPALDTDGDPQRDTAQGLVKAEVHACRGQPENGDDLPCTAGDGFFPGAHHHKQDGGGHQQAQGCGAGRAHQGKDGFGKRGAGLDGRHGDQQEQDRNER